MTRKRERSISPRRDSSLFRGSGDPLKDFLAPVRAWFRRALGEPTLAQCEGWASIQEGRHTLILAPTGSGKTLAAFLACLDQLWRESPLSPGVRVLYVSPLKALNYDIYRNLQVPLAGVADTAHQLGQPLPVIEVGVRTGDTPVAERRRPLEEVARYLGGSELTSEGKLNPRPVTIVDAIACLPVILRSDHGLASRHKLTVEEWNGRPVTATEGADLLAAAGFVHDYLGMTLYSAVS